MNRPNKNVLFIIILISVIYIFIHDIMVLFQQSNSLGIDGYYYIIQINSFFSLGSFYFPTSTPLILYFFVVIESILQNSVLSVKLGSLFLYLLLLSGVFSLIYTISHNYLYAIIGVLLLCVSGLHFYLLIEYINQLGALSFIVWGIFFLIKFVEFQKWFWLVLSICVFILAIFSHRSALPLLLTAIITFFLFYGILQITLQTKNKFFVLLPILGALCLPAIIKIQPFVQLPLYLQNEFTIYPRFPSHFATLPEIIILLFAVPIILFFVIYKSTEKTEVINKYFFGTLALWSLLITINPFISSGYGFLGIGGRLRTLACLQVALLVPSLLRMVKEYDRRMIWVTTFLIVPLMLWSFLSPLPNGAQKDYLTRRESLIAALKEKESLLEKESLIVADHGDQFVVTAVTGLPSAQSFPLEKPKYASVFWLINEVPPTMTDNKMIILFGNSKGFVTVLVKHDEDFEKRLTNSDFRRRLVLANPHLLLYLQQLKVK